MKIVIYDCGWGGDAFADKLEEEFPVLEVIRIIDWRHGPYCELSTGEIRRLAEEMLGDFVGKVDAIILANYEITAVALGYLQFKYPEQLFIGMSWPIVRVGRGQVVTIATDRVRRSRYFRKLRRRLPETSVVQTCDTWMRAVDDGESIEQIIKDDTVRTRRLRPKVVILGATNLVDIRDEIGDLYQGALVLDGYAATIKKLCRVLNIRGTGVKGVMDGQLWPERRVSFKVMMGPD